MPELKGKTLFITGASRGIGLAIALRAARDGANIVVAAKTTEPHAKLPGTIYTAAEAIREAGGRATAGAGGSVATAAAGNPGAGSRATVNQKVDPRPGSLEAPIVPCIRPANCFEMARPSPVPP